MISNWISYDCEVCKMKCKNFIIGCVKGLICTSNLYRNETVEIGDVEMREY